MSQRDELRTEVERAEAAVLAAAAMYKGDGQIDSPRMANAAIRLQQAKKLLIEPPDERGDYPLLFGGRMPLGRIHGKQPTTIDLAACVTCGCVRLASAHCCPVCNPPKGE